MTINYRPRPRRGFVLALGGVLLLAAGLVGGVAVERTYGPGAAYVHMEDLLADQHVSTKVTRLDLQDACFSNMASRLGDMYTVYHPLARESQPEQDSPAEPQHDRSEDPIPVVSWPQLPVPGRRISWIRIKHFNAAHGVAHKFVGAVLSGDLAHSDGIVLDLRGNPGGTVSEAAEVASVWIGDSLVCRLVDRHGTSEDFRGSLPDALAQVPTAVLVDGSTASAAEIIAAALQDYGAGRLFGALTFGKHVATLQRDVGGGSSLTLTSYRWFSPRGRTVERTGLMPDEYTVDSIPFFCSIEGSDDDQDVVMQRAIVWLKAQPRRK